MEHIPPSDSVEKDEESKEFEFLSSDRYLKEFIAKIKIAKNRVYLQTMSMEADHVTLALFNALKQRTGSGLDLRVHVDAFAQMVTDGHMDILPLLRKQNRDFRDFRIQQKKAILSDLENSGVEVNITNPISSLKDRLLPAHGRTHVKLGIADDTAYIGGLNLSDAGYSRPDFMIRVTDPIICAQIADLIANPPTLDTEFEESSETRLLYDAGKRGESIILDTAIRMINEASNEIYMTSQFYPDGKIVGALSRANTRGVKTKVIVANPEAIDEPHSYMFNKISQLRYSLRGDAVPLEFHPRWIHTKLLITDPTGDRPMALAGTHNLSEVGVQWGNAEASLCSSNVEFIQAGVQNFQSLTSN